MTTETVEASEKLRAVLKSILRSSKGIDNEEVLDTLRSRHADVLHSARQYVERIAVIKLIGDVSDKRRAIVVAEQNQGELFDLPHPDIISLTIIEDGKPKKIRKDFLDATLEEADRALAPAPIKVPNVDKDARARSFVERLRPLMKPGMTFRQALDSLSKKR